MNARCLLPLIAVTAILAGLALKPVLRAQVPPASGQAADADSMQRPFGHGGLARQMLGRLHLSAEQKKAGLTVLRAHQPVIKPLVDGVMKERAALRALSKAPTVDEAAIRAQSARVAAVEADLAVQRAYLAHDLRALATPEQLQTLDMMQAEGVSRRAAIVQRVNDWITNS